MDWRLKRKKIALLASLVLLALFPFAGATFYTELVTKVMILAIFALSLDLLVGYTGLVSFGHAAFFGVGAYTLGLLAPKYEAANLWLTLPAAIAFAGICALVVGAFVVRVKGIYFIMVTLAFAQMFYFVFHDTKFGRGSDGISMNFKPVATIGDFTPFDLANATHVYYFVFAAMLLVFVFLRLLLRSAFGRALAGLAGYLSAMQFGFINPELLSWHQSGNVLLMLILGGLGSLYGAVVGAFAFVALQELFSSVTPHWQLLLGGTIILLVIFLPGGLASVMSRFERTLMGEPSDE